MLLCDTHSTHHVKLHLLLGLISLKETVKAGKNVGQVQLPTKSLNVLLVRHQVRWLKLRLSK